MTMPNLFPFLFLYLFLFFFLAHRPHPLLPIAHAQLLPIINEGGGIDPTKTPIYIVHVKKPPDAAGRHRSLRFSELKNWYISFLPNATLESGEPRMVYAYRKVMSGFAARLTPEEVEAMEDTEGFVTAYPEREHTASTTYTPIFLGLRSYQAPSKLWDETFMGAGQIIGIIDSGISPNHPSFRDGGMPLPPAKWGGKCFWGNTRTCNNKLLGAVGFRHGAYANPFDNNGHGTHVASTAAGNFVSNANFNGQASGTASGMAPRAHLAVYKVLFVDPTSGQAVGTDSDILAGIDQAIRDKVDILQMSLGAVNLPLYQSPVSIGSFAAITNEIVPCAAIGNNGTSGPSVLANDAPWILSVGASTIDRRILAAAPFGQLNTAPAVAVFSSRGPSYTNGGIIKPDVIAPGVDILAAWPQPVGPTGSIFNFLSGTSMATPHVSGVVALLRNKHPSWSPAMIKSAIMTTAYTLNLEGNPITDEIGGGVASVFARGSGHLNPEAAANPGLVYETKFYNYVHYLCGYYRSDAMVRAIIRGAVQCSQVKLIPPEQLNYPSFSVNLDKWTTSVTVRRVVTNVGIARSVYNVRVDEPEGVRVVVKPATLQFSGFGQELSYEVMFSLKTGGQTPATGEVKEGSLSWDSEKYLVGSPIAVTIL